MILPGLEETPTRILCLTPDRAFRERASGWLSDAGYETYTAVDAAEARGLLDCGGFGLLIGDVTDARVGGLDFFSRLERDYPEMVWLAAAPVQRRHMAVEAISRGAAAHILLPLDRAELLTQVRRGLEWRAMLRQSESCRTLLEREARERTADVRRREEELALRLVSASEYRDNETGAHIRRIGLYSGVLAEALGWPVHRVDDIRIAATMHDVGKIGVPDTILLKPGKLTPAEFEVIKTHTEIGAGILDGSDIPLLQMAHEIALSHHERWDGSGYPRGLAGEAIPESARIVAIADVYDALIHERVYKPAVSEAETLALMTAERGKHFEPRIFDCFLRVVDRFRAIREEVLERRELARRGRALPSEEPAPVWSDAVFGGAASDSVRVRLEP